MSPCGIYCQGMDLASSVNGRLHMCLCLFWRAHCVIQETDVCVFSCLKVEELRKWLVVIGERCLHWWLHIVVSVQRLHKALLINFHDRNSSQIIHIHCVMVQHTCVYECLCVCVRSFCLGALIWSSVITNVLSRVGGLLNRGCVCVCVSCVLCVCVCVSECPSTYLHVWLYLWVSVCSCWFLGSQMPRQENQGRAQARP